MKIALLLAALAASASDLRLSPLHLYADGVAPLDLRLSDIDLGEYELPRTVGCVRHGRHRLFHANFAAEGPEYCAVITEGRQREDGEPHDGIDVRARGRIVYTGFNGETAVVARMGNDKKRSGKYVVLRNDNGVETVFCHLKQTGEKGRKLKEGDTVYPGDTIGYAGETGRANGRHLHYEVNVDDKPARLEEIGWSF